ncbi:MAG: DUF4126 family protein [Ktedonobacteraceae bacterium]|nr:DUF4126 family protein [Ktedonobacteraceae bacterium]
MVIDTVRGKISDLTSASSDTTPTGVYIRSATLGFVGGLRSMTPFAALSLLRRGDDSSASSSDPLQYLNTPVARVITGLLAVGEIFGDKLPMTPSRLAAGPLAGRLIIGALVGWAICRQANQSPIIGALLGAVGAASGSVAGYYARTWLVKVTKLPSPVLGAFEDLLALGVGALVARKTA